MCSISYIYVKFNNIYNLCEKKISMQVFKMLPDSMFTPNPENDFLTNIEFIYPNNKLNITNKFKWAYSEEIDYSDLKELL